MRRHSVKAGIKETSQQKKSREARRRKNEMRITKMSLVIFLAFLFCYLPVTVSKLKDPAVKYPGIYIVPSAGNLSTFVDVIQSCIDLQIS